MTTVYPIRCQILNDGSGTTRVDVYDDIGEGGWFAEGLTAKAFSGQMSSVRGPLEVHINSGGGDVFDGIAIANSIRAHKGPVTTVVDGIAASIASVIAQAGQERVIRPGAMLMIHDAFGMTVGNAAEMAKMAETLDQVSGNIAAIYADRCGGTADTWRAAMKGESWYTADEAVSAGLADRTGDEPAELPAGLDLAAFSAVPGRIAARLRSMPQAHVPAAAAGAEGAPCQTCGGTGRLKHPGTGKPGVSCPGCGGDGVYAPGDDPDGDGTQNRLRNTAGDEQLGSGWVRGADGKVRFDPDGDGDDDSTPEGDTDHDYFNPDGSEKKPVPPCPVSRDSADGRLWALVRQALRAAASGVDSSPWDASKAWAAGAASDDPAAFYAGICAGTKAGDKSTQAAWALPYKYHPDDPPNAAGVTNALSRLPQTEGLTNAAEAKKTLQAAMKTVNPDYEPDDSTSTSAASAAERYRAALKGATA